MTEKQNTTMTSTKVGQREKERAELYRSIWGVINRLRGATSIESWGFKNYILGLLFYRFLCENIVTCVNDRQYQAGYPDFDYTTLTDEQVNALGDDFENFRQVFTEKRGYFVLPSQLFSHIQRNKDSYTDLGATLLNAFHSIEASADGTAAEGTCHGLFDDIDVTTPRLGASVAERNAALTSILDGIAIMDFGTDGWSENAADLLGDTYEFVMNLYATNSGRSGGEYFTPPEVSRLLALIATHGMDEVDGVYDPTCGAGGLLLQAAKVLDDGWDRRLYGQELNWTTYRLCKMNLILHGLNHDQFDIRQGDTLKSPQHYSEGKTFDAVVANYPFSVSWEGNGNPAFETDGRFAPAGVLAPKGKADMAFIMHCVASLSKRGRAAVICLPGILYRKGAEQRIRQYLVDENLVEAVIRLPSDLFYGTGITTDILVLSKGGDNRSVRFVDASDECEKVLNGNRLTEDNIQAILDWVTQNTASGGKVDGIGSSDQANYHVRHVTPDDIKAAGYNLLVTTYISPRRTGVQLDIVELDKSLEHVVSEEMRLRGELDELCGNPKQIHESNDVTADGVWMPLSDVVTVPRKRIPSGTVGAAGYVGVENLLPDMRGCGDRRNDCPDATTIEFRQGDILIGNIRPYLRKIWLANADGATNGDVLLLRVNKEWAGRLLPSYLTACLSTDVFFEYMMRFARGSKMPRGDREMTLRYEIWIPSIEVQQRAIDTIRDIEGRTLELIDMLEAERDALIRRAGWWHQELVGTQHDFSADTDGE